MKVQRPDDAPRRSRATAWTGIALVAIMALAMPTLAAQARAISSARSHPKAHAKSAAKKAAKIAAKNAAQSQSDASKNAGEANYYARMLAPAYVLLIPGPMLYDNPTTNAMPRQSQWRAGLRLAVLKHEPDPKAAPAVAAMSGWFQVAPHGIESRSLDGWVLGAFLAPPPQDVDRADLDAIGKATVDASHGIPPEYEPKDLVPVGPGLEKDIDYRLRREAAKALEKMFAAAKADGIKLRVVSAYRSWAKQQELYQAKLSRSGLSQDAVARPGHSEHQLGLAVDLNGDNPATAVEPSFGATPAAHWLLKNAPRFGFAMSFTPHNQPKTGIAPEPWHYRYWGRVDAPARHAAALGNEE